MQYFPILELLQDSCDPPLTHESIEVLEILLGFRLPEEYSEFLVAFNGGHFSRSVEFSIPDPTKFVTAGIMGEIYGEPGDGIEKYGLVKNAKNLRDRIPPEYLPIADCNSQDLVLLKFGPNSGFAGVWYWDSSAFWISEEEKSMFWLADSFIEFLSILRHDVCADEPDRETQPLFLATERGNLHAVQQFVVQDGNVETRNARGQTLLAAAAMHSWPKIVRLLLEHGADPNARDRKGRTPLHHAATHSIDSVKLLLAAGADATARDNKGKSVLAGWSYRADQILQAHGAVE